MYVARWVWSLVGQGLTLAALQRLDQVGRLVCGFEGEAAVATELVYTLTLKNKNKKNSLRKFYI